MPQSFSATETINRSPADVWATLTDWPAATRWMNGIDSMSADGDTAAGTHIRFHTRGADRDSLIASCEPGRSIVLRSQQGGVTADYVYRLEPVGEAATRVTLVAECNFSGLHYRLLAPLIRFAIRRTDGGQIADLKRLMEQEES